jgi:beta-phosphoglucomutase-like phosphatase (HAD superfamily)
MPLRALGGRVQGESEMSMTMPLSSVTAEADRPRPHLAASSERPLISLVSELQPALELDGVAAAWQIALDSADRALAAAGRTLTPGELQSLRTRLGDERRLTAQLLERVARTDRVRPAPWLSFVPVTPALLGLPSGVEACLFDLDGVLTDSVRAHAEAWAEVFDNFLLHHANEEAGRPFIPFDRDADYRSYVDGRPRLEGIHSFLASRGLRLPEGRPTDPAEADTAYGLARRKGEALAHGVRRRGVTALTGARRYLEAVGHAGLARGVISSSAHTLALLELAGLSTLVEARVDAALIRREGLHSRPAPDVLLAACRLLEVDAAKAVTFVHTPDGVAAGRAAGLTVIGVGDAATCERLSGFGANRAVTSLSSLLDPRLVEHDLR